MAKTHFLGDDPSQDGCGGGTGGIHPGEARGAVGGESRTRIEAEPSKPQQGSTQHDEGDVVGAEGLLAESLTLTDDKRENQRRNTGVDMNNGAAREVNGRHVCFAIRTSEDHRGEAVLRAGQQSATPHHVGHREVSEGCPDAGEDQPG